MVHGEIMQDEKKFLGSKEILPSASCFFNRAISSGVRV
jgi:hypothetical protein